MDQEHQKMLVAVRAYCELIDGIQAGDRHWLQQIAHLLPQLHAAVLNLRLDLTLDHHRILPDLDARFELYTFLHELLGERDRYWLEYDHAHEQHGMSGSLADDLTDIYCELKHGLRLLDHDWELQQVILCWWDGFRHHWGQHLVDAERHIYTLRRHNQLVL